jgi:chloramphenicol-sensitive protein RarD
VSVSSPSPTGTQTAVAAGVLCYLIWGFIPLAFQQMAHNGATPWEIMAHRAVWGVAWALLLVFLAKQWNQTLAILRNPKTLGWLTLSASIIAVNWIIYILAVNSGRTLDASLGYYLNPLLNMAAGAWIFRERISGAGKIAMGLAAIGVAVQTVALGHAPWVSLGLAMTFAAYGIIRKRVQADAQTGLFIECLILTLPGLAYMIWLEGSGQGHFFATPASTLWLLFAGPVTVIPLMLFSWAARRMPLSSMGFLQFLAPTIVFFIGMAQGEPLNGLRIASFVFIWAAVLVFIYGAVTSVRRRNDAPIASELEPGLVEDIDEVAPR